MNPGDIVLIRFPRTDLNTGKLRPALVVATAPGRHDDILLALVSSKVYQAVPDFDVVIELADEDYEATRLKVRSVVRLARLATVEASIVNARLGRISNQRLHLIKSRKSAWLST